MQRKKTSVLRIGGMAKSYGSFLSIDVPVEWKGSLLLERQRRRTKLTEVARDAIREYIENHKLPIPTVSDAEKLVAEFSRNERG